MKTWSVARRLTLAVVLLQLVSVVLAGFLASAVYFSQRTSSDSAAILLGRLAPHIVRDPEGGLEIEPAALDAARAGGGDFWLFVSDGAETLTVGELPDPLRPFLEDAIQIVRGVATVSDYETPAGPVTIAAGNVRQDASDFALFLSQVSLDFLTFVLVPSVLLALLVVPRAVRYLLRPITDAAHAAERMEVGQSGQRLPGRDAPDEILALIRAVNGAFERLDGWSARQRRFIADAAHELRTPITVLQVRMDALPPGPLKDDLMEDCHRLSVLAERLLEIERARADDLAPATPVDLNALAHAVAVDLGAVCVAEGTTLAFEPAPRPVVVAAHAEAIRSCIVNLVDNALRHGGPEITLTVLADPVPAIEVADSGPGVRPDLKDRVFEPFVGTPGRGGAGLGLALVREIMLAHQGEASLVEATARRTRFRLCFPPEGSLTQG